MESKCPFHAGNTGSAEDASFALMLKRGTQDLHDEAEAGPFQQRMVDGRLLREEYAGFIGQMWHVQGAIEPVMREAVRRDGRVAAMVREEHFRLPKIEQDLRDLGVESPAPMIPGAERFVSFVSDLAGRDPVSLIGVLYVKEGATNGNKIVAKRIRESLGLGEGVAMGYLDPHGEHQRTRWYAFKGALDAIRLSTEEKHRCLDAARATFQLFMDLSDALDRSASNAAGATA